MRRHLPIVLLSVAIAALPARAATEASLKQALAESAKAPVTAFERTLKAEVRPKGDDGPTQLVERFTPTGHASGRWSLVSLDGKAPTPAQVEKHRNASAEAVIPGFHRLHLVLSPAPTRRTDAGGKSVFLWPSLPEGAVLAPGGGGDISRNLSAEATVEEVGGKPLISKVRIFAAKPFKIRGIATMNSFEVVSIYRLNGTMPVLASQTSHSDVKAPFGLGGVRRSVMTYRPL